MTPSFMMIVQSIEWKWCGMLTFVNDCCGCLKLGVTFLQPGTAPMRFAFAALFGLRWTRPLIAEALPVAWARLVPCERACEAAHSERIEVSVMGAVFGDTLPPASIDQLGPM